MVDSTWHAFAALHLLGILDQVGEEALVTDLSQDPRATVVAIAERVGLSRNTVQARLARFDDRATLTTFDNRIDPAALGYPLTSFINIQVTQRQLSDVARALTSIPEVLEVSGLSGAWDLLARVVARDADDLYRIAGQILASPGVERTESSLVMRRLVNYRLRPIVQALAGGSPPAPQSGN